jgi:hypothetical protein
MTLVLTAMTPRYVVQAADRLLTKGKAVHDPAANKTIICRLKNSMMVLSYSGIAYIGRQPTDEWLAELLWGEAIGRGPDGSGPAGLLMGQRPNDWSLDQVVAVLKQKLDSLSRRVIDRGGLYLSLAGWRTGREPARAFVIEIQRPRHVRVAAISGTPRRMRPGRAFVIGRIGANIVSHRLLAAFDRYRPSRTLNMEDVEQTFVETIRSVARKDRTVGPNVLCTMLPVDRPAICRFHAATVHSARVVHRRGETVIPVAHTPWIMSSGSLHAPQMCAGKWISDLDGHPLVFDAPAPVTGILGIAATLPRPGP